jgi:ankyrin repeat protein
MATVKALVQLGAEVETENFKGMTAAMIAKKSGFPDIERFLHSSRGAG